MKLIIAGGREFNDYGLLNKSINELIVTLGITDLSIVSGGARGADALGEQWALEHGITVTMFPAEWDKYGKSAGYRRNAEMAKYADALLAFWDGKSRGTKHMIDLSIKMGLHSYTEYY